MIVLGGLCKHKQILIIPKTEVEGWINGPLGLSQAGYVLIFGMQFNNNRLSVDYIAVCVQCLQFSIFYNVWVGSFMSELFWIIVSNPLQETCTVLAK